MRKPLTILILIAIFISSCKKELDTNLISKNNIGLLTDSTQVRNLKKIFAEDSLVFNKPTKFNSISSIEIFNNGELHLELRPLQANDSTSVIESVQIFSPKYKTDKGLNLSSTFKDIDNNYTISSIDNLLNSVVISVNEINASFTIDKKELPANTRFDRNLQIESAMIPDNAKIKYFMIHWN
jgi:hypothetical protein